MAELNYEEDLAIDPSILDEEWLAHSAVCKVYSKALADEIKALDKLEERKKVVFEECKDMVAKKQAEIDLDIRANPKEYDCPMKGDNPHVTEAWVTAKLTMSPILEACKKEAAEKRAEIINAVIEKTYEVNILKGAVENFTFQRKASLENLVTLHGQQYWAGPKEPRDLPSGKRFADAARNRVLAFQSASQKEGLNRDRVQGSGSGGGAKASGNGNTKRPARERSRS